MTIYINGKEVHPQILATNKPTLDETLESFSFDLLFDDQPMPFAPCQEVIINFGLAEPNLNLFLVSDNVEVFSTSPLKFKHSLVCVQNTRKLSKHLVRNSVFSQPSYLEKKSYNATTFSLKDRYNDAIGVSENVDKNNDYGTFGFAVPYGEINAYSEPLSLETKNVREKINKAYVQITLSVINGWKGTVTSQEEPGGGLIVQGDWKNDIFGKNDFISAFPQTEFYLNNKKLKLRYKNEQGTFQDPIDIIPTDLGMLSNNDWFPMNQKVRCKKIEELAKQGYNDFEIIFSDEHDGVDFFDGKAYPFKGNYPLMLFFQVEIVAETYYYSAYDVLSLLLSRQIKSRKTAGGTWHREDYLFNLPNPQGSSESRELYQILSSTSAPNFIFTQCTMYECVAEVFRLFDAIFAMDGTNTLKIEYFNERNGKDVTSSLRKVGQNSSSSEDKYTTGLVSYYQNATTRAVFPNSNMLKSSNMHFAPVRTTNLGTPSNMDEFGLITPKPIKFINNLWIYFDNEQDSSWEHKGRLFRFTTKFTEGYLADTNYYQIGQAPNYLFGFPNLDIAHYIVPEELWTILETETSLPTNFNALKKVNTLYYTKNSTKIDIATRYKNIAAGSDYQIIYNIRNILECAAKKMAGYPFSEILRNDPGADWSLYRFKIDYLTDSDGRTKVEGINRKYDGETLVDQYSGAVDLNKMGLNILGLTLKLGEPTLTVTQKITSWAKRIKPGDIYNYEGKMWIANVVNYTIMPGGYIQSQIQFVKDFNALAMRTQLLREKRLSNISDELTVKSEDNIVEYVYFNITGKESELPKYMGGRDNLAIGLQELSNGIGASLGAYNVDPNDAKFDIAAVLPSSQELATNVMINIPMIRYGAGNMICFEMSYSDSINAGNRTTTVNENAGFWDFAWLTGNVHYLTTATKYAADSGLENKYKVIITSSRNTVTAGGTYPYIEVYYSNITLNDYYYYKQTNEIFALNYQLCFLPIDTNEEFIGSEFINNNAFVTDIVRSMKDIKVWVSKTHPQNETYKYSVLDIYANVEDSVEMPIAEIRMDPSPSENKTRILIRLADEPSFTKYNFAITDLDNKILFAANKPINGRFIEIGFSPKWQRSDDKVLSDF